MFCYVKFHIFFFLLETFMLSSYDSENEISWHGLSNYKNSFSNSFHYPNFVHLNKFRIFISYKLLWLFDDNHNRLSDNVFMDDAKLFTFPFFSQHYCEKWFSFNIVCVDIRWTNTTRPNWYKLRYWGMNVWLSESY